MRRAQHRHPRLLAAAALAISALLTTPSTLRAQALSVVPVSIELAPRQMTSAITITNEGDTETSIQARVMSWLQPDGGERLVPSDDLAVSPPIATIAPGASQIVRLVLRHPPHAAEATYRLLLDQIPPPEAAGIVRLALRLSLPIFAKSSGWARPELHFALQSEAGQLYLTAANQGDAHDKLHDIALSVGQGRPVAMGPDSSPYILAGASVRRRIVASDLAAGERLRLTGHADSGEIDQPVTVTSRP